MFVCKIAPKGPTRFPPAFMRAHIITFASRSLYAIAISTLAPVLVFAQTQLSARDQTAPATVQSPAPETIAIDGRTLSNTGSSSKPTANSVSQNGSAAADQTPVSHGPQPFLTLFPHSLASRYWISGQANVVFQWHPSFPAAYSGPHSLRSTAESATSKVYTLYLGYELTPTTAVYLDAESAGGTGLSSAFGLAGFTNLDVVRNPSLGASPYLARLIIQQIIPLSGERVESDRDELHLFTSLPARRIEIRIGKFGLPDFLDVNSWGSDSHLQFLNWTVDNNGAWDYAANTRGYTDGVLIEFVDRWLAVRFAEALMPKIANGIYLDADLARAHAENLEIGAEGTRLFGRPGAIRFLSYLNTADMGNYEQSVADFRAGLTPVPDITFTRRQGRHKYGFGVNLEQQITSNLGLFGRLGWSDGRNESFAYTEVDRTAEAGIFSTGGRWHRLNDRAGAAFVANGIVKAHQEYLALGGLGFLLGDGGLSYGPEEIFEGFYTAHLWRGFFVSADVQHINNPGYNRARGPVLVPGARLHVDF
jgi:high affinity Mn2+ porin